MAQQRVDRRAQVVDFALRKPLAGGKIGARVGRRNEWHSYKINPMQRPIDGYSDNEQDICRNELFGAIFPSIALSRLFDLLCGKR